MSLSFLARTRRTAGRAAADDAWRVVEVEDLEQLGTTVGLERAPCVFGQEKRVARQRRCADLDHDERDLVTTRDLPEPTLSVDTLACVPAAIGRD